MDPTIVQGCYTTRTWGYVADVESAIRKNGRQRPLDQPSDGTLDFSEYGELSTDMKMRRDGLAPVIRYRTLESLSLTRRLRSNMRSETDTHSM